MHYKDTKNNRINEWLSKIEEKKKVNGSRKEKKLKNYSDSFNEIFNFFLQSYRRDILSFCGSNVEVKFDIDSNDAKFAFRLYDNGQFKNCAIVSSQPNVLRAIIIAKKSWGLFVDQWSDGINEWCFTKEEILSQFDGLKIPQSFMNDFDNVIAKKRLKRLENEISNNRK